MPPETLNLLIGGGISIASVVVGIIVGSYFQGRLARRQRLWEMYDRALSRQHKIWDERIKEAREYVEAEHNQVIFLSEHQYQLSQLSESGNPQALEEARRAFHSSFLPLREARTKEASIKIIGDAGLEAMLSGLHLLLAGETVRLAELLEQGPPFDVVTDLRAAGSFVESATRILVQIKARLDLLAERGPTKPPE